MRIMVLLLFAIPCFGQEAKPAVWQKVDLGWWTRAHAVAAGYDGASTLYWQSHCRTMPYCREADPVARVFIGERPSSGRMALFGAAEVLGVALIPNSKVRRVVQVGLIGVHVYAGTRNFMVWHGRRY